MPGTHKHFLPFFPFFFLSIFYDLFLSIMYWIVLPLPVTILLLCSASFDLHSPQGSCWPSLNLIFYLKVYAHLAPTWEREREREREREGRVRNVFLVKSCLFFGFPCIVPLPCSKVDFSMSFNLFTHKSLDIKTSRILYRSKYA